MAASTQQKLDYLLKKIGYTASKTGLAEDSSLSGTKKAPFAESIPSPLITANTSIWTDSESIPGTPPGSDSSYVKVYLASASGHRMTVDSTVSGSRAFIAYSTYNNTSTAILGDWIDTQFGDSYIIKVYKGDPNSGGTLLSAAGSGSNDTWFFDYASGVLNFNGTVVPSGVTDTNIYIVGYRYIGAKGTATSGISTTGTSIFENITVDGNAGIGSLNVTGVTTLAGNIFLGNSGSDQINVNGGFISGLVPLGTDQYDLGTSGKHWKDLFLTGNAGIGSLTVSGISTLNGDLFVEATTDTNQLNVTGVSTFSSTVTMSNTLDFGTNKLIKGESDGLKIETFGTQDLVINSNHGGGTDGDIILKTGSTEVLKVNGSGDIIVGSGISVVGVSTFVGAIDANGNLDVDGYTELDQVNVSAASTFGGLVDIDAGAQANTLKVEDLTDNRLVIAGTGGELEDTTKLTFDGSTFAVVGDATFSGNVTIGGTLTKEDVTNIDSVGLITAQSGVRVTAGGLIVTSGVSTFSDSAYFPDNSKINIGDATSPDLQIYHSGAHTYIKDSGTGALVINSDDFYVNNAADNETLIRVQEDVGVKLYDGANTKRFETTSTGSIVTGILTATSFTGTLNTAAQTNITSVGTLTSLDVSGSITGAGDLTLTDTTADSAAGPELKLFRNSASPDDADYLGQIKFAGESDTGVERNYAKITGKILDASNTNEDGIIEFAHIKAGSQTITGRFRSDSLQLLNGTALSVAGDITANGNIAGDGSTNITGINAITAAGDITANGNITGDSATIISGISTVGATTYYGSGAHLTGIVTATGITTTGTSTFENITVDGNAGIGSLNVTGVSTFTGTITANGTANFNGNVDLGNSGTDTITPNGRFDADILPHIDNNQYYRLGTPGYRWYRAHFGTGGVKIDDGGINVGGGLTVTGISTLGITSTTWLESEQLNVTGVSTFGGVTKFNQAVDITGSYDLTFGTGNNSLLMDGSGNITWDVSGSTDLILKVNSSGGTAGDLILKTGSTEVLKVNGPGDLTVGSGVSFVGVITATEGIRVGAGKSIGSDGANVVYYGDGSNLTGTGGETLISGITVQEESSTVGTAGSITILDFQGATVTASASGSNKAVITLAGAGATDAWTQDSQANLVAGTGAGASRDSDTLGNIAIGSSSAALLNAGDYNVSIGTSAGVNMTSGLSNVVIGHCAAYHSSGSSHRNIYMGQEAGKCKQGGGSNIGLGLYALYGSSTPGNNTSSGNIALGECAGKANTSGSYNLLFGRSAGENTTTGSCNVIIGSFAAGSGTITSQHNVIFGKEAAKNITSGGDNFIGGYRAVGSGTLTGSYNAIFGREAGCSLTSGGDNFIAGRRAACGATSAHNSIIIGYLAASGATLTGNQNILMGTAVAKNLIGAYNVMFGLHSGCQLSDASHNVFVGHYTAKNNTGNMCYSVAIGHKTDLPITAGNTQLAIGCNGSYWINGDSSFNVGIGITNPTTKLQVNGTVKATDVDTTSDIRLKTNIKPIDDPLAKVIKIEGVSFNWKEDNRPALGVIADQVEKIIPELVRGDDPKSVNYNGLIGLLIEAVKEQQTEIEALKDRISKLE